MDTPQIRQTNQPETCSLTSEIKVKPWKNYIKNENLNSVITKSQNTREEIRATEKLKTLSHYIFHCICLKKAL